MSTRQKFLPTPADRQLAAELKRRRNAAGLSQRTLAKRIGVSFHTVYRVETLQRPLALQALRRIEEILGSLARPPDGVQPHGPGKETVSDEERVLLALYRAMPQGGRVALLGQAVSGYLSAARDGAVTPPRIDVLEKSDPGIAKVLRQLGEQKQ